MAGTAKAISDRKDYSVRACKVGEDELGLLTDAFNHMLNQIQERDTALRTEETRKSAILDSALDGIISMDHLGRVLEFNPAAERIFEYTRDQVIGKDMAEFIIPPSLREEHRRGLRHFLATGKGPVVRELPLITLDHVRLRGSAKRAALTRSCAAGSSRRHGSCTTSTSIITSTRR